MYEDLSAEHLKKSDEEDDNEDSGTWSYSYPSYSRFTFTGKTKSRLGRSHSRVNPPTAGRDNATKIKGNDLQFVLTDTNNCNMGLSSQVPKTPSSMSWLQKDKLTSSNNYTPGSNIFRQSTTAHDSQISVDDSGIDVSSQSNFLFTLKNDSIQNSSSKRNLVFNTPFKFGENRQESSLKEPYQIPFHQHSFPKLKFTSTNSEENKENAIDERKSGQDAVSESTAYDIFQNKIKQTSDKNCEQLALVALDDYALKSVNCGQLLVESNKLHIAANTDDQRIEDESSNIPIDLSSSKCITHENIFSRSFPSESEYSSEHTKDSMNKNELISTEIRSSDGLSSILPTFLAPINKIKSSDVATTSLNELPSTTLKHVGEATGTDLPVTPNEITKPLTQARNAASSWFSENILGKTGLKPSPPVFGECKPTSNHWNIVPNQISGESHAPNLLRQNNKVVKSNEDPKEKVVAQNYSQLSAIVNLPNCENNENLSSKVSCKMPTTKTDPYFQPLDNLSESSVMKLANNCKSSDEFILKNNIVEDRLKTLTLNCKSNEGFKNIPLVTTNSAASISCRDPANNRQIKGTHSLNFNSNNLISLSLNHPEKISSLKKSQDQLSYSNRSQDCSAKTFEPQLESFSQRVAKESRTSPQDPIVSVNQNPFLKEPVTGLQQEPEILQQKTYLAPQQSSDHRVSNDFPHVKPDAPQLINNRLNCQPAKKPQQFKMSAPRGGLLSRSNTDLHVNDKVYTMLSMLGRGGSSEVYQVLDERSSKLMAVKCVDLSMVDKTIAEGYLNEIDLLSKLQGCASVIRMFDYEYVQEYKMLYVVMEKGDTDLSQLIRDISKTKKISMSMIIYYWTEMLTAVRDIHEKGIIHSDLKPANFLLVSGRLKLIDFGIASSQGDMTSVFKEVTTGTWNYMSPEAIKNTSASAKGFKITYKSDVWSLGCILYNLIYGKTPFSHITSTWSKLQAIADPNHQVEFPEIGAPLVLAEALQSCLRREPKLRPTVAELLALPYHASGDSRYLAPVLRSILPLEWWSKISHLFQEVNKNEDDVENTS